MLEPIKRIKTCKWFRHHRFLLNRKSFLHHLLNSNSLNFEQNYTHPDEMIVCDKILQCVCGFLFTVSYSVHVTVLCSNNVGGLCSNN